jgi:hypothetical protein
MGLTKRNAWESVIDGTMTFARATDLKERRNTSSSNRSGAIDGIIPQHGRSGHHNARLSGSPDQGPQDGGDHRVT